MTVPAAEIKPTKYIPNKKAGTPLTHPSFQLTIKRKKL